MPPVPAPLSNERPGCGRATERACAQEAGARDFPERPRVAAFFDMDRTLVATNTAAVYLRHQRARGRLTRADIVRVLWALVRYRLDLVDMQTLSRKAVEAIAGQPESELAELCERIVRDEVRFHIYPEARALVESHRARGDVLVLLTASTPYMARPVARELGIDHVLSTELEVDARGRFTGRCIEPVCFGSGKLDRARTFASAHAVSLAESHFYTDSHADLGVLEAVGKPCAVNPDPRLWWTARRRRWPVLRFREGAREASRRGGA